ncbi:murein L,D-transpeptidase catalytic domain-containing protein [Dysgonomonas mossii]|uniref:murein L,D-transpeptidase catalytic domain-containing protein n=1 Tax=Dysgonomonas mossii TaxID=163665 RepID=UPI0039960D16
MKTYLPIIAVILLFTGFVSFICYKSNNKSTKQSEEREIVESSESKQKKEERKKLYARLKAKADEAKVYSKQQGLSSKHCILIDFSIHSGKNRFFVWDFAKDSIKYESLCCHGYGQKSTQSKPVFSNVEGSYCSSLGKYKTGARSYSTWGINVHYKLHGLEKTNSNAFKRIIVLHSHNPVANKEVYPNHLPLGWSQGCPVINNEVMRKCDALLKESKKPLLLWIYN